LWINAIPAVLAAVALLLSAAHSDRTHERRLHVAVGLGVAALGIVLLACVRSPSMTMVAFSLNAIGGAIANGPFWALATGFLSGAAAAGGIAFMTSVGNSGSFFGPVLMGYMRQHASNATGLLLPSVVPALSAPGAFLLPPGPAPP